VNNPTYLNRYRQSLLTKQQELLTANGGRLVLGPAGGLAGVDVKDQAPAESEEAKPEEEKPSSYPLQGEPPAPERFIG
jgi:hypothetical protein